MVFGGRLNDKSLLKLAQSWKLCYDECIQSRKIWFLCKHILLSVQGCLASNMLFNPFLVLLFPRIAKFCCQNHFDTVFLSLYFDMKSSHSHTTQKLALQLTNPICHHLACSLLGFGDSSAHLEGFLLTILPPPPYQACVPNHNHPNFPQIPTIPHVKHVPADFRHLYLWWKVFYHLPYNTSHNAVLLYGSPSISFAQTNLVHQPQSIIFYSRQHLSESHLHTYQYNSILLSYTHLNRLL